MVWDFVKQCLGTSVKPESTFRKVDWGVVGCVCVCVVLDALVQRGSEKQADRIIF